MYLEANRANTEYLIDGAIIGHGGRTSFHPDRAAPFTITARFLDCYGKGGASQRLTKSQVVNPPLTDNRVIAFYILQEECFEENGCRSGDRRCSSSTNPSP